MRPCSIPGCAQPETCGVGPLNEPMCLKHYEEWLASSRRVLDFALEALFGPGKE